MSETLQKILYIEDDEDIAELTQMVLEEVGCFEVKHCLNGKEALDIFTLFQPQLVLVDVMMPEMDGPTTLKNLRKLPEGKNLPVIFLTAKGQAHQQERYLDMGASGVILKPFGSSDLCQAIQDIWQKHQNDT